MFPYEITQYPNWVCWRNTFKADGKATKLPYNPLTGQLASVSDPSTWTDYTTACIVAQNNAAIYSGIGFVLSDRDPYTIIDLDDSNGDEAITKRQVEMEQAFDSYSEISPSGRGLHIIVRGFVPDGRRRGKIEVYSNNRYFTMTGQTYRNVAIADRQFLLNRLWEELRDTTSLRFDAPVNDRAEEHNDEAIYNMACGAENGEKFQDLWNGDFNKHYPSQSEADFALINILSFYSRNIEQIKRMFLFSALGKRDKAKRKDYVEKMVKRSFDNQPPMIPLETVIANARQEYEAKRSQIVEQQPTVEAPANPFAGPLFANDTTVNYDWTVPPGLLGDISQFVFQAAPRPVKEIALAAAISLMAGICGRAYNVSGTGLNQYVMILAKTGTGKEAAASGIDRLMQALRQTVPAAADYIGPAEIASGQALDKYLAKNPCFVSIVGEFGLALQQMCSPVANGPQISLRRTLLKLYNKSGATDVLRQTIYSDKEKNSQMVKSPAFSLLGESVPETFFAAIDEHMVAQGLFPRFLCVEYTGDRPPLNSQHIEAQPSADMLMRLAELAGTCLISAQHNRHIDVQLDAESQKLFDDFNTKCDWNINKSDGEVSRQLWNRGHIKALKLAALIAIGLNPYAPVINIEASQWAMQLVERDINNVLAKFDSGRAGKDSNEVNQVNELLFIIKDYLRRPSYDLKKYSIDERMHFDHVIAQSYLSKRLLQKSAFRSDRMGATFALKRAVQALKDEGSIREVRQMDVFKRYQKTLQAFAIIDFARFV